jgi:hypothetical protein
MGGHLVWDVVDLVKDDELDVADDVCAFVEHRAEDLRRHDEQRSRRVDAHVASDDANVAKRVFELAVLLIWERLDGGGVNHARAVAQRHGDGVLRNDRFASGGVGGNEDAVARLQSVNCLLLPRIKVEFVLIRHIWDEGVEAGHVNARVHGELGLAVAGGRGYDQKLVQLAILWLWGGGGIARALGVFDKVGEVNVFKLVICRGCSDSNPSGAVPDLNNVRVDCWGSIVA